MSDDLYFLDVERLLDHAKAHQRGERIRDLADACIRELIAHGVCTMNRAEARAVLFHVLADDIYGNAAIDIPPLREDL